MNFGDPSALGTEKADRFVASGANLHSLYQIGLSGVRFGSSWGPVRVWLGSGWGPFEVRLGSSLGPVGVWFGSGWGLVGVCLVGVWLGGVWLASGWDLVGVWFGSGLVGGIVKLGSK